jgi:hypothetical protein
MNNQNRKETETTTQSQLSGHRTRIVAIVTMMSVFLAVSFLGSKIEEKTKSTVDENLLDPAGSPPPPATATAPDSAMSGQTPASSLTTPSRDATTRTPHTPEEQRGEDAAKKVQSGSHSAATHPLHIIVPKNLDDLYKGTNSTEDEAPDQVLELQNAQRTETEMQIQRQQMPPVEREGTIEGQPQRALRACRKINWTLRHVTVSI